MMVRKFSLSWKANIVPLESTLLLLSPKPCIDVIGMNTRRNAAWRIDAEIANEWVPPRGNQVPPLEEVANDDQALSNPPAMTNGHIRDDFLQMAMPLVLKHKPLLLKINPWYLKQIKRWYPNETNILAPWPPIWGI